MTESGLDAQQRERLRQKRFDTLHQHVVAKHLRNGFQGRWTRRDWAHASLFGTMAVLIAAIVPGLNSMPGDQALMKQQYSAFVLPMPALHAESASALNGWHSVRREKNDKIDDLLASLKLSKKDRRVLNSQNEIRDALRSWSVGESREFSFRNGVLDGVRYAQRDGSVVSFALNGGKFKRSVVAADTETRVVVLSGEVGNSLIASAKAQGLNDEQINTLTNEVFKYDVDLEEDVSPDDRFSVVVEQTFRNGELVDMSDVLAATLTTGSLLHSGYRFEQNGKAEYFTADGRPLKKEFIRTPIPYAPLSSSFGGRRHPVLGVMRMHKGIDYRASSGTPIMAAGDARVVSAGRNGGYGNAVILDHGRGITTLYGHMSRIAKIRPGQRVEQGTIIGYVGSTGLSTGPHLHYEFRVGGVHRNPLTVTKNAPEPLRGAQLQSFYAAASKSLAKIQNVEAVVFARKSPAQSQLNAQLAATSNGQKPLVNSKAPELRKQ